MSSVKAILALETIDELSTFLESQDVDEVRVEMLARFDQLIEYSDADQWAVAVRVCETLAMIGWGDREPVDAISHFNGDCWETRFVTAQNEFRFQLARWSKRKAGWTICNPEFRPSPDFPDRPAIDWQQNAGKEYPIVDRDSLPSQRNYRRQMPISMGVSCGRSDAARSVVVLRKELAEHLRATMTPDAYGDAIEKFYFTLHRPDSTDEEHSRLKVGAFNAKQKASYADLYLHRDFAELPVAEQRVFLGEQLLAAVDALAVKLKKRKLSYDIASFRSHVELAIQVWTDDHSD
ncbi:hypothetical protein AB1L30_13870 [Bremerella sp. JC817]|uniref:hypothetical protein n=1 Tax=Bremerella sp. JC817 TaxID=3231756 RepID=UPI00345A06D5